MFDIGWQEIFIIAVLALIVVGPKDLPHAVRTITRWIRKARGMAREFQGGVNEMIREAELDDIKKQISSAQNFDIDSEFQNVVDPDGDIAKSIGLDEDPDADDAAIDAAKPVPVSVEDKRAQQPEASDDAPEAPSTPEPAAEPTADPMDDDVMPTPPASDEKEQGA